MKLAIIENQTLTRQMLVLACGQLLPEAVVFGGGRGAEAVALCQAQRPDLIILNLVTQGAEGLAIIPEIQAIVPGVKIIVLTRVNEFVLHRAQQAGVQGFIDKDGQPLSVLQDGVRAVLGGGVFYCSASQAMRSRMRADPLTFSKLLSEREIKLLSLFGQGWSNEELGERLKLRPNTVRNHRQNIMTKLGLSSTPQLIRYALEKGFTTAGSWTNDPFTAI